MRRDAIALLHAELGGVGDRRRAAGARGERAEDRDLVDRRARRARRRRAPPGATRAPRADRRRARRAPRRVGSIVDRAAHVAQDLEEPGARRVQADAPHVDAAPGHDRARPRRGTPPPRDRRGRRSSNAGSSPDHAAPSSSTIGPTVADRDAERAEHALGVIARDERLAHVRRRRPRRGPRAGSRSSPARSRRASRTRARTSTCGVGQRRRSRAAR